MKHLFYLVFTTAIFAMGCTSAPKTLQVSGDEHIVIRIQHTAEKEWRATYSWNQPATRLTFTRDQNVFRAKIFRMDDPSFAMFEGEGVPGHSEKREYIARKDGKPFREVSFAFGPFYDDLPRDYEFALGFTDGSTAIHTGHFDVTTNPQQRMQLEYRFEPLASEQLVFNAKAFKGRQTWSPSGDIYSIYVYFGKIEPMVSASLTTLADPGLPEWLKKLSASALPAIFKFYEDEFRQHPNPFVIVNIHDLDNESKSSSGGGSSPGWIQMGLSGGPWKKASPEFQERFLSTLAHEGTHQFQGRPNQDFMEVAWLMEGSAEFFAYQTLRNLKLISDKQLKGKLSEATKSCLKTLGKKNVQLKPPPSDEGFSAVYTCGHLLHHASHLAIQKKNRGGMYELWRKLGESSKASDGRFTADAYFQALKDLGVSEKFQKTLRGFVFEKHSDPKASIANLLARARAG